MVLGIGCIKNNANTKNQFSMWKIKCNEPMVDWQCIFCCCSFETQMPSSKRRWKAIISEMVCDWKNRSCWSDCWLIWMHYGLALLFKKKRIIIIITRETIRESHNDQIILFYIFLIFFLFLFCAWMLEFLFGFHFLCTQLHLFHWLLSLWICCCSCIILLSSEWLKIMM